MQETNTIEDGHTRLSEKVSHLELVLSLGKVSFDVSVRVVDDGQEHVEQDEEDEEHVQNKERRTNDEICKK